MPIALGFSRELSSLAFLMSGSRVTLGKTGEIYAQRMFEAHGYLADIDHQLKCGDLKVITPSGTVMRVEVKAARVNKDGYYQFCVTRRTKQGRIKTSCKDCDALVLLGIAASGKVDIYVVPAKVVTHQSIIKIGAKQGQKSRWKQYRQHLGAISLNEIEEARRDIDSSGNIDSYPVFTRGADYRASQERR